MTEQTRHYDATPGVGSKPKLRLQDLQREAEKYHLEITPDPKGGYRVNRKDGVAWATLPKGVFQRCSSKFHTLSEVQNLFTFIDNKREYEAKAREIAEDAERWLREKGRYSTCDEQIIALLEEAIAQIAILRQKEKDERWNQLEARRLEWAAQNNLLTREQIFASVVDFFHLKQFEAAIELKLIQPISFPNELTDPRTRLGKPYYYRLSGITSEQIKQINQTVLLTRVEAADLLGVNDKNFDALKKKHKLEPADFKHSRRHGWNYYLYRLSDILSLAGLLDGESEAEKQKFN